jgi:hypothetical protein
VAKGREAEGMKFFIRVIVDGKTMDSKVSEGNMVEVADAFYKIAGHLDRYSMELVNGGIMVLPSESCKRAIFLFIEA